MEDRPAEEEMSLAEAKAWLRPKALKGGARCPCCDQWTQIYKTPIHSGMGKVLALICSAYTRGLLDREDYLHVEHYTAELKIPIRGYHGKLRFWNLVEAKANENPKKKDSGYWRPTPLAFDFVAGRVSVPRYAFLFNNACLHMSEEQTTIHDVMRTPFDYSAMVRGISENPEKSPF